MRSTRRLTAYRGRSVSISRCQAFAGGAMHPTRRVAGGQCIDAHHPVGAYLGDGDHQLPGQTTR